MSHYYWKCEKCKRYTSVFNKWCKPCEINYLKDQFTNWTSGDEIIDNFIQVTQLKICFYDDIVFEWIPYDQFIDIKETSEGDFSKVYSAIWKNGPLCYDYNKHKYIRSENKKVTLKWFHNLKKNIYNLQNIYEFMSKVCMSFSLHKIQIYFNNYIMAFFLYNI
jgi:hypothetical protein